MIVYYQRLIDDCDDHSLLNDIANFLKKYKNATLVEVDSYNPVLVNEIECTVWDCELIIHEPELDIVRGICLADAPYKMIDFFIERNNEKDVLLVAQFQDNIISQKPISFKIIPTVYTRMSPNVCLDTFYSRRLQLSKYEDKFVFRGNVDSAARGSADLLVNYDEFAGHNHINMIDYYNEIINYKVGLSIPGVGEKCHRDVEYMAIGLPIMKFEYTSTWNPILIPNYHYISIDRIDEYYEHERIGGQEYVELYLQKFNVVKNNTEFLEFISKNAREYYQTNLHPISRVNSIIKELLV